MRPARSGASSSRCPRLSYTPTRTMTSVELPVTATVAVQLTWKVSVSSIQKVELVRSVGLIDMVSAVTRPDAGGAGLAGVGRRVLAVAPRTVGVRAGRRWGRA